MLTGRVSSIYQLAPQHGPFASFPGVPFGSRNGGLSTFFPHGLLGGAAPPTTAHPLPPRHKMDARLSLLPPPRTKWTRRVTHPVLIGHAASLTPLLANRTRVSPSRSLQTGRASPPPAAGAPAPRRAAMIIMLASSGRMTPRFAGLRPALLSPPMAIPGNAEPNEKECSQLLQARAASPARRCPVRRWRALLLHLVHLGHGPGPAAPCCDAQTRDDPSTGRDLHPVRTGAVEGRASDPHGRAAY